MELINGSIELRFWIIILLIFILVIIPVFCGSAIHNAKLFQQEFERVQAKAAACTTQGQEYSIIGEVMNYNYYLHMYQEKTNKWGIFAPYNYIIRGMKPITLNFFDTSLWNIWDG